MRTKLILVRSATISRDVFHSVLFIAGQRGCEVDLPFFIRKVIICEPPFEAVQLNIQYL